MKTLNELTEKEFNVLKDGGILKDFYPDAPLRFKDIKTNRPQPKPTSEINIEGLIILMEGIFDDLEEHGYAKDSDYWAFEALLEVIYGDDGRKWVNKF